MINKTLLPTYDIFDEYRYFEQNTEFSLIRYKGYNIAVTICEDLWFRQPILTGFGKDRLYSVCPMDKLSCFVPIWSLTYLHLLFHTTRERSKRIF